MFFVTTKTPVLGFFHAWNVGKAERKQLDYLYIELDNIFRKDGAGRNRWLATPNGKFGGRTPMEAINQGDIALTYRILREDLSHYISYNT